jgi:hypothetical protein
VEIKQRNQKAENYALRKCRCFCVLCRTLAINTFNIRPPSADVDTICVQLLPPDTCIIIIISAERRLLLDIGLPQSSPRRSVLRCPHPSREAASRDLQQIVGPPCRGPTNAASLSMRSPFEDFSAPTAFSPPRNVSCPLSLEVCNSSGYVGDLSPFMDLIVSDSIT